MQNVLSTLRNLFSTCDARGGKSRRVGNGRTRLVGLQHLEDRRMFAVVALSAEEQLLLELVNRQRANPTAEAARYGIDLNADLDPGEISTQPKQPVAPNASLRDSARLHADNMLERDFFGHVDPLTGTDPSDRARAAGYPAGAGENIAWLGESRPVLETAKTYEAHENLFRSEGHRRNTMTPHYRELGTGVRFGQFRTANDDGVMQSFFSIMAAENFGNQGGDAFITGIAYTDASTPNNFYEVGEGISGAMVRATNADGTVFSVPTSATGGYTLRVPNGVYSVSASGNGLASSTFRNVVIDGVNQKVDFNARNRGFSAISGRAFEDANGNGTRESNEPYLANLTINLGNNYEGFRDNTFATATTNSEGFFQFNNLPPEPYRVFVDPAGNRQSTTHANGGVYEIDLRPSQRVTTLQFALGDINEPPVAVADSRATFEGVSVEIDVAANDTDDFGIDRSSIIITDEPKSGTVRIDAASNNVVYFPNAGHTGWDVFGYKIRDQAGVLSERARVDVRTDPGVGVAWQNPTQRMDVNNDGSLSPIDALLVINDLIRNGPRRLTTTDRSPPPFIDVNGDGSVSAIDALQVLNNLNNSNAVAARPIVRSVEPPATDHLEVSPKISTVTPLSYTSDFAAIVDVIWDEDPDIEKT